MTLEASAASMVVARPGAPRSASGFAMSSASRYVPGATLRIAPAGAAAIAACSVGYGPGAEMVGARSVGATAHAASARLAAAAVTPKVLRI